MKNTIVLSISVMIFQINTFAQWLESNGGMGYQSVGALLADSDTLYAGTTFGVFKSTNEGDNWSSSSNGLTPVTNFYALVRSGNFLVGGGILSVYGNHPIMVQIGYG